MAFSRTEWLLSWEHRMTAHHGTPSDDISWLRKATRRARCTQSSLDGMDVSALSALVVIASLMEYELNSTQMELVK